MNRCPVLHICNGEMEFDYHDHWVNISKPALTEQEDNINLLELVPVWLGIVRLIKLYRNVHIVVLSDNNQVVNMLNKGKSRNVSCTVCVFCANFFGCVHFLIYMLLHVMFQV